MVRRHSKRTSTRLVKWLWLGGLIMGLGGLLALWPDAREKKRFLERHASRGGGATTAEGLS